MAIRARLIPPQPQREAWPWHHAKFTSLAASIFMHGDRRMEAENYLASGYGVRLSLEARPAGWVRMGELARVWQPSRLKGIQVSPEFGTPFLAATQVFDLRPVPRKWLSLERTHQALDRFVESGTILVTCSGSVGRATLAHKPHENILISHDLLRIQPKDSEYWGWLYAYLRAPQVGAMMRASQYGHIIKHLEVSHLNSLPIILVRSDYRDAFNQHVKLIIEKRNRAHVLLHDAEEIFEEAIGPVDLGDMSKYGYTVSAAAMFQGRRRLEGCFHNPIATRIIQRFKSTGRPIHALADVTERIWWMTRFKRIFGDGGVPYISAEDLFSLNPPITKRLLVEQANNADGFFVKAGWIVMACSGQTYGVNGSVVLMTEKHESSFLTQDLIRIAPDNSRIRPAYLFVALGHPRLGRPLVIRYAHGTSIPHIEPTDIATFPVIRLDDAIEARISDLVEMAIKSRDEADELENSVALKAEEIIDRFIAGEAKDMFVNHVSDDPEVGDTIRAR